MDDKQELIDEVIRQIASKERPSIWADAHPPVSPAVSVKLAQPDLKLVQEHLCRIGLLDPPADGKWGVLSASAWRAFVRVIEGEPGKEVTAARVDRLTKFKSAKDLDLKPKNPEDKENVLAVRCLQKMQRLGMFIAVSMGSNSPTFNIFYLKGTNPDGSKNEDKTDYWNDLRFLAQVAQDGTVILLGCWLATVEPGWFYRRNRMNPDGAFQIELDKQFFAWCLGRHGGAQYPALVQNADISGFRDGNEDGDRDGDKRVGGSFGVNQHHGYNCDTVGRNSAGCLVGKTISGHESFYGYLIKDRRVLVNSGYLFASVVLSGV